MSYSDNMVEPGAIVEALNKETEYTTKKHKLKKKYKKKLKKHPSRRMAKGNPVYVISSNDQFMRYLFGNYAGKEVIDAQYREVEGAK